MSERERDGYLDTSKIHEGKILRDSHVRNAYCLTVCNSISFSVRFLVAGFFGFVFRFLRAWMAITFRELILYDVENLEF